MNEEHLINWIKKELRENHGRVRKLKKSRPTDWEFSAVYSALLGQEYAYVNTLKKIKDENEKRTSSRSSA